MERREIFLGSHRIAELKNEKFAIEIDEPKPVFNISIYKSRVDKANAEEEQALLDYEDHVVQMPWVPTVEPTEAELLARTQLR